MQRNAGVDVLKFICAFMVICIHIPFPQPIGTIITPITRIAVPIFFMITGYFYSFINENNRKIKQIKKIAILTVVSYVLYLFYMMFCALFKGQTIIAFLRNFINLKTIVKFIFLNESPFSGHLWYMGAILYVLIIIFLIEKRWNIEKLYPFIPILDFWKILTFII